MRNATPHHDGHACSKVPRPCMSPVSKRAPHTGRSGHPPEPTSSATAPGTSRLESSSSAYACCAVQTDQRTLDATEARMECRTMWGADMVAPYPTRGFIRRQSACAGAHTANTHRFAEGCPGTHWIGQRTCDPWPALQPPRWASLQYHAASAWPPSRPSSPRCNASSWRVGARVRGLRKA